MSGYLARLAARSLAAVPGTAFADLPPVFPPQPVGGDESAELPELTREPDPPRPEPPPAASRPRSMDALEPPGSEDVGTTTRGPAGHTYVTYVRPTEPGPEGEPIEVRQGPSADAGSPEDRAEDGAGEQSAGRPPTAETPSLAPEEPQSPEPVRYVHRSPEAGDYREAEPATHAAGSSPDPPADAPPGASGSEPEDGWTDRDRDRILEAHTDGRAAPADADGRTVVAAVPAAHTRLSEALSVRPENTGRSEPETGSVEVQIGTIEIAAEPAHPAAQERRRRERPGLEEYERLRSFDWDDWRE